MEVQSIYKPKRQLILIFHFSEEKQNKTKPAAISGVGPCNERILQHRSAERTPPARQYPFGDPGAVAAPAQWQAPASFPTAKGAKHLGRYYDVWKIRFLNVFLAFYRKVLAL